LKAKLNKALIGTVRAHKNWVPGCSLANLVLNLASKHFVPRKPLRLYIFFTR